MNAPLRVLVLWFPDWPLRAALGAAPPHPPTALVHANTVVACTATAREHGVRTGQRRRVAQGHLSSLQVLPHDPARDERAFLPVLRLIEKHAPGVTLLRPGLAIVLSDESLGPSQLRVAFRQLEAAMTSWAREAKLTS